MRFGLLGPLTVAGDDGEPIDIRGRMIRNLVAILLCQANQPVAAESLIDTLWGAVPPDQARANLRVYVHRLRHAIGESRIDRSGGGYHLVVRPGELDVDRFRMHAAAGRDGMSRGDPAAASEAFRAALACWRGPALAGTSGVELLGMEAYRLEEQRLDVLEQCFEAELALGRHGGITPELRVLSRQYPLRETIQAQLMRALAGRGMVAEAVAVFEETRRRLAEEFGLDPGQHLRDLHLSLLRNDQPPPAEPRAAPAPPPPQAAPQRAGRPGAGELVPRQLPAQTTGFTGRGRYLRGLDALLDEADRSVAMPVAAITGTAGIGKTTLAVHWAHGVSARFPDGQLYLNLHGFDPARPPVEPVAALGLFLAALGVPQRAVPAGLEERESLYRSRLADRRVLVVLDNANDASQVRPLLPGSTGCFVLVTSRNQFSGLVTAGAHPIVLDLLTPDESRHLLRGRLGQDRVAAEPAAVADIVARCGGLPLPLSIVAARTAAMAGCQLAALAAELGQAGHTLDGFASDDATVDLRAVFSWSYRVLSEPAARMFRLLALHPGPDVSAKAAASLAGVPAELARAALAELSAASLLQLASPCRYAYHDLVRAYAIELAERHDPAEERRAAVARVLDHYLHTAYPATLAIDPNQTPTAVDPPRPGVVPEALTTTQQALAWFDVEHPTILAAVARAADGFESHAWQLAWSAVVYLERTGRWSEKIAVLRGALAAARRAGEHGTAARALRSLGRTYGRLHQYDTAYRYLDEAIGQFRELGDVGGQAQVVMTCAETLEYEGRYQDALARAEEAYQLSHSIGNTIGAGRALGSIGYLHALTGGHRQAIEFSRRALDLFVAAGDLHCQASACDTLGVAHQHLGDHEAAVAHLGRALELLDESGERFFVAIVLDHLGDAHQAAGDHPAATAAWRQALAILTDLAAREADGLRAKLAAAPVAALPAGPPAAGRSRRS